MSLRDDLRKLILNPNRGNGGLSVEIERQAIPASRGDADYSSGVGSSGGLKPPFTEQPAKRVYYDERTLTSSDGVFVIVYRPIKSAMFKDKAGALVPVIYVDE